ncbi:ABC transporter permease [Lacihabitans sp. LS3-19]|uniref:ABC transporter permease n=1 Tax=Lacihabitans sp. LS3-19 TaxID=2487335 RepID=UPI0020CFC80A|nr:ABC transporter permease [Lacihabitans sp. LS3-19]MCP9767547.1 ABC transporter permease [Lacihabitans sp. LS3-19]
MNNILLIIQREYVTRVKKKSFIIMTIVGPLLMTLMYAGVIWAAISSVNQKKIEVLDESHLFEGKFKTTPEFIYEFKNDDIEKLKSGLKGSQYDALVFIPENILEAPKTVKIYSEKGVTMELQGRVESAIEKEIETIKLTEAGITKSVLESAKMDVSSETISLKEGGEKKSSAAAASIIGGICAFLIYLSVFIYGAQVMRSITEEKTSRIVEILISSVKPFQLMIGKIVGVALVGLTQFGLWIVLTAGVFTIGGKIVGDKLMQSKDAITQSQMANLPPEAQELAKENMQVSSGMSNNIVTDIIGAADTLPIATIVVSFLFYFVGGYLLYSALFGAVGSAVDSDTDTQQFMLPITIPIIAAFMIAQVVIRDPHSNLAIWTSMIPFTSPIIMMVRIPFGVPIWQIILSVLLLIGGFMFTTWIAARIYRVGILMYGKKVTWKELGKWIFYKN